MQPNKKPKVILRMILDTISILARAQNTEDGLSTLTERIVDAVPTTFCHIMLLEDGNQSLVVKAASPISYRKSNRITWDPGIGKRIALAHTVLMQHLLELPGPKVYQKGDIVDTVDVVQHIQDVVKMEGALQSALVIPLRVGNRVLGICTLGEMRSWKSLRTPFTSAEKIKLANSLATQGAVLIDRIRLYEATKHKLAEVERLRTVGEELVKSAPGSLKGTLDKVAQAACEVIGASSAVIYPWNKENKSYNIAGIAYFGLKHKILFSDKARDEEGSMTGIVVKEEQWLSTILTQIRIDQAKLKFGKREVDFWKLKAFNRSLVLPFV